MIRTCFQIIFLIGTAWSFQVHAEKADLDKPTNVEANQMAYDDVKQVNTFIGNVILTRGTLTMKAHKMVVTQDPSGYQYATLFAAPGGLTTFRQKRDGGPNLWIEGEAADRIEYDNKTEIAKLFSKAKVRLMDGNKITDEVQGEFISYNAKAEFYSVNNSTGGDKSNAGRIRAIIQPRTDNKGQ